VGDTIENPWSFALQLSENRQAHSLPPGTSILQVYDKSAGELLVLGEPGSGKTTLLLELARDLINRAKFDEKYSIPVVFNLSSWGTKRQPLDIWLIEELQNKYQVPRPLGQAWIDADQILLLLDGLDEVVEIFRPACIKAINAYRRKHGMVPIIVCCRNAPYLALSKRLTLSNAVFIEPLSSLQIDEYLIDAGEPLEAVRVALRIDPTLEELASTPLMLSILTLAYHGRSVEELLTNSSFETRRQQVFATYIKRMIERRGRSIYYTPEQTIRWLAWLAVQMVSHNQTEFYIERIQPDWLTDIRDYKIYHTFIVRMFPGLFIGVIVGTLIGSNELTLFPGLLMGLIIGACISLVNSRFTNIELAEQVIQSWKSLIRGLFLGICAILVYGIIFDFFIGNFYVGLLNGIVNGFFVGLLFGLIGRVEAYIKPVERVAWSWKSMWYSLSKGLVYGTANGLLVGFFSWLVFGIFYGPSSIIDIGTTVGMLQISFSGVLFGIMGGLFGGLSRGVLDKSNIISPNQGIRLSARNSLFTALFGGIFMMFFIGICVGLCVWLTFAPVYIEHNAELLSGIPHVGQILSEEFAIHYGIAGGIIGALIIGLQVGGLACIKHVVIRLLLHHKRDIPLNYPHFLDYATEHLLLHKVGGGYIFVHRFLLDYFAMLGNNIFQSQTTAPKKQRSYKIKQWLLLK